MSQAHSLVGKNASDKSLFKVNS